MGGLIRCYLRDKFRKRLCFIGRLFKLFDFLMKHRVLSLLSIYLTV